MAGYEYDMIIAGAMGRGRDNFLTFLNEKAAAGWRYKTMLIHESDTYYLFEKNVVDAAPEYHALSIQAATATGDLQ